MFTRRAPGSVRGHLLTRINTRRRIVSHNGNVGSGEVVPEEGDHEARDVVAYPTAPIVARPVLAQGVRDMAGPFVLLAGGSGMGKTNLLAEVQAGDVVAIAPQPTPLTRSAGSLQTGLMRQLAAVLATRTESAEAQEVVLRALRKFVKDKKSDLAKVVVKEDGCPGQGPTG